MRPFRKLPAATEEEIQRVLADQRLNGFDVNEHNVRASICVDRYENDRYMVHVRKIDKSWVHLSIKRHDRETIHDWRDLQTIKNALVGLECEAVEIYPADSRLVDACNQYHLWACTDPLFRFPWGFNERLTLETATAKGSRARQRPMEKSP